MCRTGPGRTSRCRRPRPRVHARRASTRACGRSADRRRATRNRTRASRTRRDEKSARWPRARCRPAAASHARRTRARQELLRAQWLGAVDGNSAHVVRRPRALQARMAPRRLRRGPLAVVVCGGLPLGRHTPLLGEHEVGRHGRIQRLELRRQRSARTTRRRRLCERRGRGCCEQRRRVNAPHFARTSIVSTPSCRHHRTDRESAQSRGAANPLGIQRDRRLWCNEHSQLNVSGYGDLR